MDVHQLEVFLSVLDTGSVTRGAERVHLSPAAVSLQLQGLAEHLQTELFVRSGRKLAPTSMAYRLAEHARTVIDQMRRLAPFRTTRSWRSEMAKSICRLNRSTRATCTRTLSPTRKRLRVCRPIN